MIVLVLIMQFFCLYSLCFRGNTRGLFNAMGSMYTAILFIGVQNACSVQPVVAVERTVFFREKAGGIDILSFALCLRSGTFP